MKRRHFLLSAAAAAALLPRWARGAALRAFGGELVAALVEPAPPGIAKPNPRTLDPFAATTRLERELAAALHLPLFGAPTPGQPYGPLVEATTASGRAWTIVLRRGLRFADGSPLRAEDAAASLRRSAAAALLEAESIEARDERTLAIALRAPNPALPALLAAAAVPVAGAATDDVYGPVGCGPFQPLRGSTDRVLAANPACPAGRAYLDRLVLAPLPDPAALATALRKGQVGVATATSTAAEISGARLVSAPACATVILAIGPRVSAALRARIAASPDRETLTKVFLSGRAKPASTLLPPALLGALARTEPLPPKGPAWRGQKTPFALLVVDASAEMRDIAQRVEWDLTGAGITPATGWRSPADIPDLLASSRWDLLLFEWTPSVADAGWALGLEATREGLLKAPASPGLVGPDADERTRQARALDDVLRAGGTLVPIVHPQRLLRVASRVEGVAPDALGRVDWAEVSLRRGAP